MGGNSWLPFIAHHGSLWKDFSVSLVLEQQFYNDLSRVLSLPTQHGKSLHFWICWLHSIQIVPTKYQILWSLFPPNLFTKSFQILDLAARQGGFSWSKRSECFDLMASLVPLDNPTKCTLTMVRILVETETNYFTWAMCILGLFLCRRFEGPPYAHPHMLPWALLSIFPWFLSN